MSNPVSPPEIRAIIAEEMRRLSVNLNANYKLPQRRPIVEVIASTFPLPSPPVLPSPADDWRKACIRETDSRYNALAILSPCRAYHLCEGPKWEPSGSRVSWGNHARAEEVLASAPPPPGITPPLPAKVAGEQTLTFGKPGDPIICTFTLTDGVLTSWSNDHLDETLRGKLSGSFDIGSSVSPVAVGKGTLWLRGSVRSDDDDLIIQQAPATLADVTRWGAAIDKYNAEHRPLPPKDNKCESSSGCVTASHTPPQSASSTSCSHSASPSPSTSSTAPSNPSEAVASGEQEMPTPHGPIIVRGQRSLNNLVAVCGERNKLRAENEGLRLSLSQSQHEAEKAKGEIERLQSELAGVRGRMEAAEKVCEKVGALNEAKAIRCRPRTTVGPEKQARLTIAWIELNLAHDAWLSLSAPANAHPAPSSTTEGEGQ